MKVTPVRFVHIEDDWEQFRSLPNNLYDAVYVRSSPEVRVTIDFEEHSSPDASMEALFPYRWRTYVGGKRDLLFDYCFVDNMEQLKKVRVTEDDFFLIDIMQAGEHGAPFSIVESALEFIQGGGVRPRGQLYFSAYPEYNRQENLQLDGFDKSRLDQLLVALQEVVFRQFDSFTGLEGDWKLGPNDLGMTSLVEKYGSK